VLRLFAESAALVLGYPACNKVGWLQCRLMLTNMLRVQDAGQAAARTCKPQDCNSQF